ncbi:MAG TPA: hypothetical protein VD738_12540 [Nitrospira sp.]|nr:hypothetical protein [Nitrospira sp.]
MRIPGFLLIRQAIVCAIVILALLGSGCSRSKRQESGSAVPPSVITLTPALWFSPSLTTATVPYLDACGKAASVPVSGPLLEAVPKKLGRVLTGVTPQFGDEQTIVSDGVVEVGLGLKQIDLTIPRQVKGTYPVTITLGMEVVFLAADGALLFSEKLEGAGRGEVDVTEQSCEVRGLELLVLEAVEQVTEAMARRVSESVRVREYAELRKTLAPTVLGATPAGRPVAGGTQGAGTAPAVGQISATVAAQPTAALSFHAIIRDENHDQLLQQDEALTIEIEVTNEGRAEAKGVEVVVGGMDELAAHFPPVVPVGDLRPGEIKRTSVTKQVTALKESIHGELVLSLRSATPVASVPPAKKFAFTVKPGKSDTVVAVPDVDLLPKSMGPFKQSKAVVIAIGVGRFRSGHVSSVKYAGHDAEVMAEYLREIGNIPDDRIRVLRDTHALKLDLTETFEEWLPQRTDASTVVYVFFSGRALVDGGTGAVSLVPHDGTTATPNRLYPVHQLQQSLYRLPIQRAILIFDVSLEPMPGTDPAAAPPPHWETSASERKGHVMWMVGNRALQEAHAYEEGRHGLFTYHLLRGLQGLADLDRDGTVVAGELCLYARGEVVRAAREQFGNEQEPLCVPPPGQEAMVRIHPLARGNNPKPVSTVKKTEPTEDPTAQTPKPMEIGAGR